MTVPVDSVSPAAAGCNIAERLRHWARVCPRKRAVIVPQQRDRAGRRCYAHLTFAQLEMLSDAYARGLADSGIDRGARVLLMVRPGLDFFALTFALFKTGAVPVLIDPGMGWRHFADCVGQAAPAAALAVPRAWLLRLFFPKAFRSVRRWLLLTHRRLPGVLTLAGLARSGGGAFPLARPAPDDPAAILFTSGSTGPAKGVVYTHAIFKAQLDMLRDRYGAGPDQIDLPCFPSFALFSVGLGMTVVIPDMDPTRPARVAPENIFEAVQDHGVTFSFGSPAVWERVSRWCELRTQRLPGPKTVLMAGAPVPEQLHRRMFESVLPAGGEVHTPYGATEALPVADYTGSEMLAEAAARTRAGEGICVGRPLPGITVRIIAVTDAPIDSWSDAAILPPGTPGEIVVSGPVVTPEYFRRPAQTRLAKIREGDRLWHRMGDIGRFDAAGRLWVLGRKNHRVETENGTLYPVACEAVFNRHPRVYRSALVGAPPRSQAGRSPQEPVIVIEPEPGARPRSAAARAAFVRELRKLAETSEQTRQIRHFLFHPSFPVDVRHNAKIHREELARWATARLAKRRCVTAPD